MKYFFFLIFLVHSLQGLYSAEKPDFQEVMLYYSPRCPHSRQVLDYIKEKNLNVPMTDVLRKGTAKQELETYGGYAIVPCLFVGPLADKKPIYDAPGIIDWLSAHQQYLSKSVIVH